VPCIQADMSPNAYLHILTHSLGIPIHTLDLSGLTGNLAHFAIPLPPCFPLQCHKEDSIWVCGWAVCLCPFLSLLVLVSICLLLSFSLPKFLPLYVLPTDLSVPEHENTLVECELQTEI